jgi:hypothetical protein
MRAATKVWVQRSRKFHAAIRLRAVFEERCQHTWYREP